jgi:imidazolonepropionase-like amidohydrolase
VREGVVQGVRYNDARSNDLPGLLANYYDLTQLEDAMPRIGPRYRSLATGLLLVCTSPAEGQVVAIVNANILDGISDVPMRGATVVVRDGRIESILRAPVSRSAIPAGARVIDINNRWLLPGLIDAHVHLAGVTPARVALEAGVTTVRTGGGPARSPGDSLRRMHRAGDASVPDVVESVYQVTQRLPPRTREAFPQLADLDDGVHGADNVRRVVRTVAASGVDVIKMLVTQRAGVATQDPRRQTFTEEEVAAAVAAAKDAGLVVMAHAHGDEGVAAAVRAGVFSVEHATYATDATLQLMKQHRTFLVPSMTVLRRDITADDGIRRDSVVVARAAEMLPIARDVTARAWKAGVRLVAGTDDNYQGSLRLQDALEELVGAGVPPLAAIRAATSVAAECLRIEKRTGAVAIGLEADLIVIQNDPTENISALRDVVMVVNNGQIVLDRLAP